MAQMAHIRLNWIKYWEHLEQMNTSKLDRNSLFTLYYLSIDQSSSFLNTHPHIYNHYDDKYGSSKKDKIDIKLDRRCDPPV